MTHKLTALRELLAKVDAGGILQAIDVVGVWPMTPSGDSMWLHACKASKGSLDAAKALHNAAMPDQYSVALQYNRRFRAKAIVVDARGLRNWDSGDEWMDPARAWLIAILNALIAQEEGK